MVAEEWRQQQGVIVIWDLEGQLHQCRIVVFHIGHRKTNYKREHCFAVQTKKSKELQFYCSRYLTIKKPEKAVSNLTSVELYTENGLNLSLEKLDAAFQSEDVEDAHIFLKFSYLKRHCDISMKDYIIEFENSNHLMENQNMKY